ncbi:hypothetical protein DEO72_LG2g2565 [Vigna unguiculata]|uniref:Uncharacterized protein n=1 Tax=Vigna unguiculata TaxID=3917 RepID=A0A4D6L164_VIGUN|nr:hypothetical protein DEO72_LG2g2565 [Vigna unguiculata]
MPFRAQLKGYVPSSTQGPPTSRPLKYPKSLIDHTCRTSNPRLLQQNCLAGDTYHQALSTSRSPGRGHVPPGAKHLKRCQSCRHRLAGLAPTVSRTCSSAY